MNVTRRSLLALFPFAAVAAIAAARPAAGKRSPIRWANKTVHAYETLTLADGDSIRNCRIILHNGAILDARSVQPRGAAVLNSEIIFLQR